MAKKVILWTAPRCLSTVFYCSIATLKNTKKLFELFSGVYYYGPDRRSNMYARLLDSELDLEGLSVNELTYDAAKKLIVADYPNMDLVFTKEHACFLPESMYEDIVSGQFAEVIHTFLIRDPERALYSNYKCLLKYHVQDSYLDPPDGGFSDLRKLYNFVKERKGTEPVVIDAIDLQTYPDETMKSYCEAVGIQFDPNMTTWEPGSFRIPYAPWSAWCNTVFQSSGFIKIKPEQQVLVPLNDLPSEVVKCIDESRIHYEEMQKACIKPLHAGLQLT